MKFMPPMNSNYIGADGLIHSLDGGTGLEPCEANQYLHPFNGVFVGSDGQEHDYTEVISSAGGGGGGGGVSSSDVNNRISTHDANTSAHPDIRNIITTHEGDTNNPHNTTKAQVGLGNVDNTTDVNKPVSTAQAAAISTHDANISAHPDIRNIITTHEGDTNNPHNTTKAQVGLGNVDNTTDVNKPVSTAQAAAISTHDTSATAHTDIRNTLTTVESDITTHKANTTNPHTTTLSQAATAQGSTDTVMDGRLYLTAANNDNKYLTSSEITTLIGTSGGGGGSGSTIGTYSTTEQDTGLIWIDGKHIFRKVFTGTKGAVAKGYGAVIMMFTNGVSEITHIGGWIVMDTGGSRTYICSGYFMPGTTAADITMNYFSISNSPLTGSATIVVANNISAVTDMQYSIWLEYTKT